MAKRARAGWMRHVLDGGDKLLGERSDAFTAFDHRSWLVLGPVDGRLREDLPELIQSHAQLRPDVGIFYGDQVCGSGDGERRLFRPDFDRTRLLAQDYVGLPIAVRADVFRALGGLSAEAGAAGAYDLVLRAALADHGVERINEVLVAVPHPVAQTLAAERRDLVRQALQGGGLDFDVEYDGTQDAVFVGRRFADPPPVTLIVSVTETARGRDVERHRDPAAVDWPSDRLHVVYHRTDSASPAESLGELNALWQEAEDYVVFLDEDLVPSTPGWLAALMTFATDAGVGAAGGRIEHPQHGVERRTIDFAQAPSTPMIQHEVSAASRSVLVCRRSVLEEVNGFDVRLAGAYADTDLCLRMRLLGYRIVHVPQAAFVRAPSPPRAPSVIDPEQTALFLERWNTLLNREARRGPRAAEVSERQPM